MKKKNDYGDRPQAEYWDPELCPTCGNNDFTFGDIFDGDIQRLHFRKAGAFLGQGKSYPSSAVYTLWQCPDVCGAQ